MEYDRFSQRNSSSDVYDLSSFQTAPTYERISLQENELYTAQHCSSNDYKPKPKENQIYKTNSSVHRKSSQLNVPLQQSSQSSNPPQQTAPLPPPPPRHVDPSSHYQLSNTSSRSSTPQSIRQLPSYEKATRECRTPPSYVHHNARNARNARNTGSLDRGEGCYNVRLASRVPTPHRFTQTPTTTIEACVAGDGDDYTEINRLTLETPPISTSIGVAYVGATSAPVSNALRRPRDSRHASFVARRRSSDEDSGCGQATLESDNLRQDLPDQAVSPVAPRKDQTTTTSAVTIATIHATRGDSTCLSRISSNPVCTIVKHRSLSSSSSSSSASEVCVNLRNRCKAPLRSRTARDMNSAFTRPSSRCPTPVSNICALPTTHATPATQTPPIAPPTGGAGAQLSPLALKQVLRHLGARDLVIAASTCREWWYTAWDPSLWRHIRLEASQLHNKNQC